MKKFSLQSYKTAPWKKNKTWHVRLKELNIEENFKL